MEGLVQFGRYIVANKSQILLLTGQHAYLSLMGVLIGTLTAVPLGIFISRRPKLSAYVIDVAGMLYTVPSLALLGILIPYLGFGWLPVTVALVVYSYLPVLRNTCAGLGNVDAAAKEAAKGMGATSGQLLMRVELPLAFPVIMSGIRTVAVMTVGITTMAALVGAGGLGVLIFQGITMMDNKTTLAGTIPIAVMAVTLDQILGLVESKMQARAGVEQNF
jgi:osmoprotectant transport system permease protein